MFARHRARKEEAKAELHASQKNLTHAELELQKRIEQHPDTLEKHERMKRVLEVNHIADLMYEALTEQRSKR